MIDRSNMNYNKTCSDETIYDKIFSCAYLIRTNQHLEIFKDLKDRLLSTYEVIAEFTYLGYNGDSLICNEQKLVYRKDKFKPVTICKNVKVIKGAFPNIAGSNAHPAVANQTGFKVTLKFISYGLPVIDDVNGWKIHIISLSKQ